MLVHPHLMTMMFHDVSRLGLAQSFGEGSRCGCPPLPQIVREHAEMVTSFLASQKQKASNQFFSSIMKMIKELMRST